MNSFRACLTAFAASLLVGACATQRLSLPEPLDLPQRDTQQAQYDTFGMAGLAATADPRQNTLQRSDTPKIPGADSDALMAGVAGEPLPPLRGGPVNVNIEGMPVPAFINEFFGTILGAGFRMDPQVARMNDLVTLRTPGPQSPQEFYRLAVEVLRSYGVGVEYASGMVLFTRSRDAASATPPLIVSGRALPEVPISHRPVFQLVNLHAVRVNDVVNLLNMAFKSDSLKILTDPRSNSVILMGKPEMVRQALDAIRVFDRPFMHGRQSARLEPAFVTADELAKRLVEVLGVEGYGAALYAAGGATSQPVIVLPLNTANAVLVFASSREVLEHAMDWARDIDRPNPVAGSDSLFYYLVKNTQAKELADTINGVRGVGRNGVRGSSRETIDGSQVGQAAAPAASNTQSSPDGDLSQGRLILDEPRNALIYQGAATDWARLLPLIQQMDKAPRQVMVEVTVAEVTLTENEEFGIAWLANADNGKFDGRISSGTVNSSLGGTGLTYLLDIGGQTRASLKALADKGRINVLSTPRLMVKSGEAADFDVGTEVPTISAQATSSITTDGNTGIIQTVQYRRTGIMLSVKPVVYSDDRVDLEIRQEVSEAQPISAGGLNSPSIFNRSYSTSLSLKDGSAILIAGLMSQRDTYGAGGVPYLKDVPVLGNLFKSTTRATNKTELVLMITPYIIESDTQAEELTRSLSRRFELLDLPTSVTQPAEVPVTPSVPVAPQP